VIKVTQALIRAQAKFDQPKRTAKAAYGKYAPLEEIIRAVRPALTEEKLGFYHTEMKDEIICFLVHESGEHLEARCRIVGNLGDMQKVGGAHTYGRRYTLQAVTGIAADDDDDGNSISQAAQKKEVDHALKKLSGQDKKLVNQAPQKSENPYKNISEKQVKRLKAISGKSKWTGKDVADFCRESYDCSVYDISRDEYQDLCEFIENNPLKDGE